MIWHHCCVAGAALDTDGVEKSQNALAQLCTQLSILKKISQICFVFTFLLTFDKVHNPLRQPRETTSERPKVTHTRHFFALLAWKCSSRHNGVHFLRNLNLQKCSDAGVFCTC